ncbi:acetate--CoA ligase family protein [Streptosporangium sp. NPDC002607]
MKAQTSTVVDREALTRLLKPQTIAVVGLNNASGSHERIYPALGGDTEVFFVNPDQDTVLGCHTYPNLSSIGRPIDVVMSMLATEGTTALLKEAGRLDVGGLVSVAGGCAGTAARIRLTEAARSGGLPLIGPASRGFVNVPQRISLTLADSCRRRPGGVSVVSQSGALLGRSWRMALDRSGCGFNLLISTGKEDVTDLADYLGFLATDPDTHAIGLVVRKIRRPDAFFAAARRAAGSGKPIVMLKLDRGVRSSRAGSDPAENVWMYDIAMRQAGITVVTSPEELADRLATLEQPGHDGSRGSGAVTMNGGLPRRVADHIWSDSAAVLPAGLGSPAHGTAPGPSVVSAWDAARPGGLLGAIPRKRNAIRCAPHDLGAFSRDREASGWEMPVTSTTLPRPDVTTTSLPGGQMLPFASTMEMLSAAGIPVAPYHLVRADEDPVAVRFRFPGPYLVRLAETGYRQVQDTVRSDVPSADLTDAIGDLRALAVRRGMSPLVVVQPQLEILGEAFIGMLPGSDLGPLVVFGPGGIFNEVPQQVGGRMAPLSPGDARSLIAEFADATMMHNAHDTWRGREALAGILMAAGRLATAAREWMRSCDINSLVYSRSGFMAVDAFCLIRDETIRS